MGVIAFGILALGCLLIALMTLGRSSTNSASRKVDSFEALSQYQFPTVVHEVLARERPDLSGDQRDQAFVALREFFCLLYLEKQEGRKASLGMPSALADEAWHAFILCTGWYEAFCKRFFGTMVHHTPDANAQPKHMGEATKFKADVQRTWAAYRQHGEKHDVFQAARLAGVMVPLLFALDASAGVDGWVWPPEALTRLDEAARAAATSDGSGGGGCGAGITGTVDGGKGGGSCTGGDAGGDGGGDGGGCGGGCG